MENLPSLDEDEFWWLSPEEKEGFKYIRPGYQNKLPNDVIPDVKFGGRIKINNLTFWCSEHRMENVHREFNLYLKGVRKCDTLEGPVLLDFDNSDENLESACKCTTEALRFLQYNLGINLSADCRVFFSGRKGFHIELRPIAIVSELLERAGHFQRPLLHLKLIRRLQSNFGLSGTTNQLDQKRTFLDKEHQAKRINGSVNAWTSNGHVYRRKMVPVVPERLASEDPTSLVSQLVRESEAI